MRWNASLNCWDWEGDIYNFGHTPPMATGSIIKTQPQPYTPVPKLPDWDMETIKQIFTSKHYTLLPPMQYSGDRFIVIVAGTDVIQQFTTLPEAEAAATNLAHNRSTDVFIFKPIKKVSPKRDVVVTDLP